jgi:sporulation protein YlmC with PRC-barrel domain
MMARSLYAGLSLLDRQMVDRNGVLCGKVDDLELEPSPDTGQLYVSAILAGPGMLMYRLQRRRWGSWVQRVNRMMSDERGAGGAADPARIPMSMVSEVGDHVQLAVDHDDLATSALGHWVRRHVTSHIPGSGHEAES